MALRIDRRPRAVADIDNIWMTIAAENLGAAERWLAHFYQAEDQLADFPEIGPNRPDLANDLRSWPVGPYLILYRVEPDALVIVRVLHGARDLPTELDEP